MKVDLKWCTLGFILKMDLTIFLILSLIIFFSFFKNEEINSIYIMDVEFLCNNFSFNFTNLLKCFIIISFRVNTYCHPCHMR